MNYPFTFSRTFQLTTLGLTVFFLFPLMPQKLSALCPQKPKPRLSINKDDVYKNYPFSPNESAHYTVYWSGLHAGTAILKVNQAEKIKNFWHVAFSMEAQTGEWFKHIYIAKYAAKAFSRPEDLAIIKFHLFEYRDPPFSATFKELKTILYDHENTCKVYESIETNNKPAKGDKSELEPGAIDALSAFYKLRTYNYQVGKKQRFLTFSSKKNWWLEAKPLKEEKIEVNAGTFMSMKIKLDTYFGKELQQKGEVYVWIASKDPRHPMVKIEGDVKLGSVYMLLDKISS